MGFKKNMYRYYDFIIRQDFTVDGRSFKKGDKIKAIVCPFVSEGVELFSICDKDNNMTYVIPCRHIKFDDQET